MADFNGSRIAAEEGSKALLNDPRWQVAERASQSQALCRATQLRSILLYIVRQAVLAPDEPIHEFDIAHRVLGRQHDFNPLDDNIVRVQMTRLRKRLDAYFSAEGRDEQFIITVLPGSYKPVFSPHKEPTQASDHQNEIGAGADATDALEAMPAVWEQPAKEKDFLHRYLRLAVTIAVALALGYAGGYQVWFGTNHSQAPAVISNPLIRQIFTSHSVVNVVVADASLVLLQDAVHSDIPLSEYLDHNYPDRLLDTVNNPDLKTTLKAVTHHGLTSLNNVDVAEQCAHWSTIAGSKVYIRYARYMHVRDFEQGNFVIVGSRRSNPWTSLFEHNLNFYLEEDPATHIFHFRNQKPKPGEPQIYEAQYEGSGVHIGYVDIAILPNLSGTGTVLIFNGLRMENNEAASNLIFDNEVPDSLKHTLSTISATSKTEILLRVRSIGGAENGWEIVSIHSSN